MSDPEEVIPSNANDAKRDQSAELIKKAKGEAAVDKINKARRALEEIACGGTKPPSKLDVKWLEEHVWWWRYIENPLDYPDKFTPQEAKDLAEKRRGILRANFNQDNDFIDDWLELTMKRCQQYPAFLYELGARLLCPERIPIPWLKLPQKYTAPFIDAFEVFDPLRGVFRTGEKIGSRDDPEDAYYTRGINNLSVNLLHSDEMIAKQFIDIFVTPQRESKKINPRPNTGERRRGFSWRPIEFFDRRELLKTTLNDGERSQLSGAKKKVKIATGVTIVSPRTPRSPSA